jgi:hypothetical protein
MEYKAALDITEYVADPWNQCRKKGTKPPLMLSVALPHSFFVPALEEEDEARLSEH